MLAQIETEATLCTSPTVGALTSMPVLVLNVHSRCNCRCIMCDIWRQDTTREIRSADLERHRVSLRKLGVQWVVLSGGEPLLHSDLRSLCEFFRGLGIRLTLLTTGLLLAKRAAEIAELFGDVIVSLDGPPAIHDQIRRVKGAFRTIESGVAAVHRLTPNLKITARTTVQKANHGHLRATVARAKHSGFDGISFLAADLTSEAFNRPLVWPLERQSEVALNPAEILALSDEIEAIILLNAGDIRAGYVAESPEKLRNIIRHFRAHLDLEEHRAPVCNAPWVSVVVEADGNVRPCFFHRPIGDLSKSTLEEVVNGEAARAFRNSLVVEEDVTCRRCVCSLKYSQEGTSAP